jgi:hypothetical protein
MPSYEHLCNRFGFECGDMPLTLPEGCTYTGDPLTEEVIQKQRRVLSKKRQDVTFAFLRKNDTADDAYLAPPMGIWRTLQEKYGWNYDICTNILNRQNQKSWKGKRRHKQWQRHHTGMHDVFVSGKDDWKQFSDYYCQPVGEYEGRYEYTGEQFLDDHVSLESDHGAMSDTFEYAAEEKSRLRFDLNDEWTALDSDFGYYAEDYYDDSYDEELYRYEDDGYPPEPVYDCQAMDDQDREEERARTAAEVAQLDAGFALQAHLERNVPAASSGLTIGLLHTRAKHGRFTCMCCFTKLFYAGLAHKTRKPFRKPSKNWKFRAKAGRQFEVHAH